MSFRKPLQRQIREGVELEMSDAKHILNSKAEWNHSRIPRIVIETGEELAGDKENGLERAGQRVRVKEKENENERKTTVKRFCAEKRQNTEVETGNPTKKVCQTARGMGEDNYRKEEKRKLEGRVKQKDKKRVVESKNRKIHGVEKNMGEQKESTDARVLANKEHWQKMFSTMVERNKERNADKIVIVLGAEAHIDRIKNARENRDREGDGRGKVSSNGNKVTKPTKEGSPPVTGEQQLLSPTPRKTEINPKKQ